MAKQEDNGIYEVMYRRKLSVDLNDYEFKVLAEYANSKGLTIPALIRNLAKQIGEQKIE